MHIGNINELHFNYSVDSINDVINSLYSDIIYGFLNYGRSLEIVHYITIPITIGNI